MSHRGPRFRRALCTVPIVLAGAPVTASAQQWGYGQGMMADHGWMGFIVGPIMMAAFLVIVIVAVVLMVRWLGAPHHGQMPFPSPGKNALDILKERFAKGEIDKQEFEDRRRVLGD